MTSRFNGEDLGTIVRQLADEGILLEKTDEDYVVITEEGFDTLMGLLAITSLSAKHPINEQARQLGESIGRELGEWHARRN